MGLFKRKIVLPQTGSQFTIKTGVHKGISGTVHHHFDKEAFMIQTPTGTWIVNIKP